VLEKVLEFVAHQGTNLSGLALNLTRILEENQKKDADTHWDFGGALPDLILRIAKEV
jgi:hypothetical protein